MGFIIDQLQDYLVPYPPQELKPNDLVIQNTSTISNKIYLQKDNDDTIMKTLDSDKISSSTHDLSIQPTQNDDTGHTHRSLENRHVQLIGIGGTVGVSLFVNIGLGLTYGGPLSLLLGCIFWCIPVLCITASCAEMVCYLPISSPFLRMASRCVDPAFGFMACWNFWVLESSLIPFEITLFNTLINYWTKDYSAAIPLAIQIVVYFLINLCAVRVFGELEFWLSMLKVLLAIGLFFFTFITMVGGNPHHHAYGFTNWNPPMLEFFHTGALGRFQGLLQCVILFSYMIAGPEYVSQVAGETRNPRKVLPTAYKQTAARLTVFFVGGALCVGICCSGTDPQLLKAISESAAGAASSPYIIAMNNLDISFLPNLVNGLLLFSAFSAGNSYVFCSSRALYGLALEGKAPKIFSYCTNKGIPIFAVLASLTWSLLSLLQLSNNSYTVLMWIINLITAAQIMDYNIILVTYLCFRKAFMVQKNNDRSLLPFKSIWQPYLSYFALILTFTMTWLQGYTVFLPGNWSITSFLFSYIMIFIDIALFLIWKFWKKTKFVSSINADITTGLDEIEKHELSLLKEEEEKENLSLSSTDSDLNNNNSKGLKFFKSGKILSNLDRILFGKTDNS
ncbi:hypothetical protein B5S28_g2947 [[Candida] boidinii]|nr:hypothetical protein B5S28_g2947 [[Candida] boidinii]